MKISSKICKDSKYAIVFYSRTPLYKLTPGYAFDVDGVIVNISGGGGISKPLDFLVNKLW